MKIYTLISIALFYFSSALALECPPTTTLVSLELPSSGDKLEFCQKNFNGKLLKHGPYKRTSASGVVTENKYYTQGELGKHPPKKVVQKKKVNTECADFKKAIEWVLNPVEAKATEEGDHKTHRRVVRDRRLCRGYPRERLNFVMKGIPFNMTWKYKEKCHIQGTLKLKEDVPLKANYMTRPPFLVDRIKFDYTLKRSKEGSNYSVLITATNGEMTKEGRSGKVEFSFSQRTSVNIIDLRSSGGREGVYSDKPDVKITRAFENSCDSKS